MGVCNIQMALRVTEGLVITNFRPCVEFLHYALLRAKVVLPGYDGWECRDLDSHTKQAAYRQPCFGPLIVRDTLHHRQHSNAASGTPAAPNKGLVQKVFKDSPHPGFQPVFQALTLSQTLLVLAHTIRTHKPII